MRFRQLCNDRQHGEFSGPLRRGLAGYLPKSINQPAQRGSVLQCQENCGGDASLPVEAGLRFGRFYGGFKNFLYGSVRND